MSSKPDAIRDRASGRRATVLLVEDDRAVAALTATWLRALNFDVIVSNDGREAAALAYGISAPIDLLLADVMLPGMRGPVLAGAVRSSHPEMAVLFSSGYSPELVAEVFDSHTDTALLLRKPYTSEQLASSVNLALARKAASSHSRPTETPGEAAPDEVAGRRT